MDVSPFPYQGPLEPGQLRARADLVADLIERVTERRVTALLGPRRYGKTSALREVEATMVDAGSTVVWLDLYELSSWSDLAARLDDGLVMAGATGNRAIADFAAALQLRLGVINIELRKPERQRPDPMLVVQQQLDVLTSAAQRTPTILIVDEFAGIARIDGAAGLLRTKLQRSYQILGMLFAGSEPSTMELLFADQAQPFYGQADIVTIAALSDPEVAAVVSGGFRSTGRDPGVLASRIAEFTGGHPQRVMQLADASWRRTPSGAAATDEIWAGALDDVRRSTASGFERLFSSFETGEKLVLRVVASGGALFGAAADFVGLSRGGATHARQTLLGRGHLHVRDGRLELVDPVFSDWIRSRFDERRNPKRHAEA
jgi:uncharacterized protein